MNPATKVTAAVAAVAGIVAAALMIGGGAVPCAVMSAHEPFSTASNCSSEPSIDRVLGAAKVEHGGREYLFVNRGNEIGIYRIDDPEDPRLIAGSSFNVPNQGDSDYDLMHFSVGGRYGAAWYKMGTIIFDLGTGATPRFADHHYYPGANFTFGGLAYYHGRDHWLITASGLGSMCSMTSTLFRVSGVDDLEEVQCVTAPTRSILASGGLYNHGYIYLGDSSTRVYLLQPDGGGVAYLDQLYRAGFARGSGGIAIDDSVLVEANSTGLSVYSIVDQESPRFLGSFAGAFSQTSIEDGLVFASLAGLKHSEHTYDVSDLNNLVEIEVDFWDPAQAWNYPAHACSSIQAGIVDSGYVHLMRYSRWQIAEMCDCVDGWALFKDGFESGDLSAWSTVIEP